jgi:hypothetical protein
VKMDRKALIA